LRVKLGLGSAQFGMDYGVTNTRGRVSANEVGRILGLAGAAGIDTIDTASLYGDAEAVLGSALIGRPAFRLVTKTPKLDSPGPGVTFADRVETTFDNSCRKLGVSRVHGLLFHRASDLLSAEGPAAWARAESLKSAGRIARIGVSIADIDSGMHVARRYPIEIAQLPVNILDQRALKSGFADDLRSRDVELHARSPFLQGVLAAPIDSLPAFLGAARRHLERLAAALAVQGMSLMEGALRFVLGLSAVDRVIVGVTSAGEIERLIGIASASTTVDFDFAAWSFDDPNVIDPPKWPAKT
jgi:aryl-alcohol dehydrogenase-like predicted oxidoreductase